MLLYQLNENHCILEKPKKKASKGGHQKEGYRDEENDGLINVPQSKSDIKFAKQKNDLRDSMMSINSDIAIDAPNRLANSLS